MKGTAQVVDELRNVGYRVTLGYVFFLIREKHVAAPDQRVGDAYLWEQEDIDRLASQLRRRGRGPKS